MGWYARYINGNVDRRAEMRKEYSDGCIIKDALVGSVFYAAVKRSDGEIQIEVCLTSVRDGEFAYKPMVASMGPRVCDCPESILRLNTSHEGGTDEWIQKCRDKAAKKRSLKAAKTARVKLPFDTGFFTQGEILLIEKCSSVNKGRTKHLWFVKGTNIYLTNQLMTQLLVKNAIEIIT